MPKKTLRLHLESTDGEPGNASWRFNTFQLAGLDGIAGDITRYPTVKLRVESFVWSNRELNLDLAFAVHLDNANFVSCYRSRNNSNAPTIIHVGVDQAFYSNGPGSNEYEVDTNWLKRGVANITLRRIDGDDLDATAFSAEANVADWFMTLAITYGDD
jgi:hypothetical protein